MVRLANILNSIVPWCGQSTIVCESFRMLSSWNRSSLNEWGHVRVQLEEHSTSMLESLDTVHWGRRHGLMSLLRHMRHKAKGDYRRWQRCHLVPIRVNRESVLCSISKNIHIDSPTMLCLTAVLRRCFCSVSSSCPIASDTNLRSLWKRNLYSRRSLVTRSRGLVAGIVRSRWRPVTVVKRAGQAP